MARFRQASPVRTLRLGQHKLTYLPDGLVQLHPRKWLPDSTAADWRSRSDYLDDDGFLVASVGALLVEYEDRALLIDTGFGPHSIPAEHTHQALGILRGGQLPASLALAGKAPGAIDTIAFSHLHDDHVGWAFMPDETDTGNLFGNAVFIASGREWETWNPIEGRLDARVSQKIRRADDKDEIFPGVTAWITPGHTAGHTSYVISSDGGRLIAFGDAMHSPVQVSRPEWSASVDAAADAAFNSRSEVLRALSRPGTFGYGGHFADVVFGSVETDGSSRTWSPL